MILEDGVKKARGLHKGKRFELGHPNQLLFPTHLLLQLVTISLPILTEYLQQAGETYEKLQNQKLSNCTWPESKEFSLINLKPGKKERKMEHFYSKDYL